MQNYSGLFESGFALCLGKTKGAEGMGWWLWGAGFIICLALSMVLLAKAVFHHYPDWFGHWPESGQLSFPAVFSERVHIRGLCEFFL